MTLEDFGYLDVDEQLSWLRENAPDFLDRIEGDIIILGTASDNFNDYVDENIDYRNDWFENYEQLNWIDAITESYDYVYVDGDDHWDEFHELDPEEFVNIIDHYSHLRNYPFEEEGEQEEEEDTPTKPEINCEGLEALI